MGKIKFHKPGWKEMVKQIVDDDLVPRAEKIAAGSNADSGLGDDGYKAGTEGDASKTLNKGDYRATVLPTTDATKYDNAENNTLVRNFHRGEG